jgi:predicted MFS family arabinose efflux permease
VILAAFRIPSFRFQWPADLLTSWASEMETLILGWYIMVHTGSVLWLTAFGSLQFFGTLIAPMFGVLGDQLGARVMLCAMRATYAVLAVLLALLALTGMLTPVWVLVIAALAGFVRPNEQVMRNSLIGETIPSAHLVGALGLSRATMDSARVAGALAGAGLSALLGIGPSYICIAALYALSVALTFRVPRRAALPAAYSGGSAAGLTRSSRWRDLRDGLAHVLRTPELLALMWLAFLINLTAYPASGGLLPYVARQVFHADATGLGWLVASFSLGGLLASVTIVLTGGPRHAERYTLVHTAIWYALLLGFGQARSLSAGLLVLLAAGFVQNLAMISMTVTLLAAAGDRFRSRVMGVRTLAVYGLPLGLMVSGALIERIGYRATISLSALAGLALTVLIGLRWRASMWQPRAGAATLPQRV